METLCRHLGAVPARATSRRAPAGAARIHALRLAPLRLILRFLAPRMRPLSTAPPPVPASVARPEISARLAAMIGATLTPGSVVIRIECGCCSPGSRATPM